MWWEECIASHAVFMGTQPFFVLPTYGFICDLSCLCVSLLIIHYLATHSMKTDAFLKRLKRKRSSSVSSEAMEFNDVFRTQTQRLGEAIWFAILLCLSILSRSKLISWVEDSRQNWPFETNWEAGDREKTASRSRSMKYIDEVFTHDIFKMPGPLEK